MVFEVESREDKRSLAYIIQNIVVKSGLNLKNDLDLNFLSERLKNSQYNKERFPGLFTRFNHPKCAIIVFRNGKLILTGLKSFSHIELIIKRLILRLNDIFSYDIKQNLTETRIVNIVVTADFFREIDLDAASMKLKNTIYEPEVFPGLTYNSISPTKAVFLIFSTGKIVVTGIREEKAIEPILTNLGQLLKKEKLFKIT
ncbi:MAG: TATA-box-binding protein [Promethearchaeota archaeon]